MSRLTLSRYYREGGFNPVDCGTLSGGFLERHERLRRKIFEFNLRLPARLFRGAAVLEFGPASGENSLVLARWGARLHLVEPVPALREALKLNFARAGLSGSVAEAAGATLETFRSKRRFDFVIAEGFIHQVGAPRVWVPRLAAFAGPGAFIMVSTPEAAGFLIELLQAKCAQAFARAADGILPAARELFARKWESVPHSRTFEAWVMDNLASPLQRSRGLVNIVDVQDLMWREGFLLWSSWPSLRSGLDVTWIKKPLDADAARRRCRAGALRLLPSLAAGTEVPTTPDMTERDGEDLRRAMRGELDALSSSRLAEARRHHARAGCILRRCVARWRGSVLAGLWDDIDGCLRDLSAQDWPRLKARFNGKGPLSRSWGSPNLYSVWHRF